MGLRWFRVFELGVIFILSVSFCLAQQSLPEQNFQDYQPSQFFNQIESDYYPEAKHFDPSEYPNLAGVVDYLDREGINIRIGANANIQTIFELYLPMISRADYLNSPIVGVDEENRVGNVYFITHDAVHHFVGIPGMRRRDLQNPDRAREQLIRILLLKEQVATSFSLFDHIRRYWNWRDELRYNHVRKDFREQNRGIFPFGKMDREEAVDFIGDFVFGRSVSYARRIFKNYDAEFTKKGRDAGVPLPIFNIAQYIGSKAEAKIYRWVVPPVAAIAGYFGEVGYKGFIKYSEAMADFMLQDWYVHWSDDFQVGIPLNALEQRALLSLSRLKDDLPLTDGMKSLPGDFERARLRNEIAYFARRVAEIEELGKRGQSRESFNQSDHDELRRIYKLSLSLHRELIAVDSPLSVEDAKFRLSEIIREAETAFPIEEYIPAHSRLPFIDYRNYWSDMTALALPRYGHNSNGFSPGGVFQFLAKKRQARKKLSSRLSQAAERFALAKIRGVPTFMQTIEGLAEDYEDQSESTEPFKASEEISSSSDYLDRLKELKQALRFQLEKVIIPQIIDSPKLMDGKQTWIPAIQELFDALASNIDKLAEAYNAALVSQPPQMSSNEFRMIEIHSNIYLDEAMGILADFISSIQINEKPKSKWLDEMQRLKTAARAGENYETGRTMKRLIGQIAPKTSHRHFFAAPILRRLIPFIQKPPFFNTIFNLPGRLFHRNKNQVEARLIGVPVQNLDQGNGVYVFVINHETGIYDAIIAKDVLHKIGVDEIIVLASQSAAPDLKKTGFKDPSLVISESEKPLDQMIEKVKARLGTSQKVGIIVCPEGNIPSPYVSMPLAVKPGAFVLARKLAKLFQTDHPVYLLSGATNGIAAQSSDETDTLELNLNSAIQVPSDDVKRGDKWVESERKRFESQINENRAQRFIDINKPTKIIGGSLFTTTSNLRAFLPYSHWFGQEALRRCTMDLKRLDDQSIQEWD